MGWDWILYTQAKEACTPTCLSELSRGPQETATRETALVHTDFFFFHFSCMCMICMCARTSFACMCVVHACMCIGMWKPEVVRNHLLTLILPHYVPKLTDTAGLFC